jgi:streptogramin lyase
MEYSHIGKITPGGTVTNYPYGDSTTNNYFGAITRGPDGNIWVAEYFNQNLEKTVPGSGAQTTISLVSQGCNPTGIVSAAGNLYVSCTSNNLLKVTTSGTITPYYNAFGFSFGGNNLAIGPDGNPWFGTSSSNMIGEFNTTNNAMSFFFPPNNYGTNSAVTAGPDGNIWTIDSSSRTVDIYILNVIGVSPQTLTFTAGGQNQTVTVTEPGTSSWTATSSKTSVATVAQGSPANKFTVSSVAAGTAKIIVNDAIGNSIVVHVTVQ